MLSLLLKLLHLFRNNQKGKTIHHQPASVSYLAAYYGPILSTVLRV